MNDVCAKATLFENLSYVVNITGITGMLNSMRTSTCFCSCQQQA